MSSYPIFTESKTRGRVDLAAFKTSGQSENPFLPRPWQKRALPKSKNRNLLVEVPTGAGKSKFLIFAAMRRLRADPTAKLIIAVPQLLIAKGFNKCYVKIDGKSLEWSVGQDLCRGNLTQQKVGRLVDFLQSDRLSTVHDRVAICSHVALAKVFEEVGVEGFSNTIVVVDEFHRVLCSELEMGGCNKQEIIEVNQLGAAVAALVRSEDESTFLWGLTATYFRGDRRSILPEDIIDRFVRFFLPLDEHWDEGIQYIESFSVDFIIYKNIFDDLKRVLKKSPRSIIFCPGDSHTIPGGLSKSEFLQKVFNICDELGLKYLDLVSEVGRRAKYSIFHNEEQMKGYDCILSVQTLNEGADWVDARNVLDLVPPNSITRRVQRFGRLLRDIPGKKHIKYNYFLPYGTIDIDDPDKRRMNCNQLFTSWAAATTIHELIKPIKIPRDPTKKSGSGGGGAVNYFAQQVPDAGRREQIKTEILKAIVVLKAQGGKKPLVKAKVLQCIVEVLKASGVKRNRDKIAIQIAACFRRMAHPGIDVLKLIKAGFEKVWHDGICDGFLRYATATCGTRTFKELRAAYDSLSLAEVCPEIAKEWHPTKNGKLTPADVHLGTHDKAWWKCSKCGHEWEATVYTRVTLNCNRCSKCLSLVTRNPEIAKEWHPTKNGKLTPADVHSGTSNKVWWKCSKCGHEWEAKVCDRTFGSGCPGCWAFRRKGLKHNAKSKN